MNFKIFQRLYSRAEFDEIQIIGQDIEKEGRPYHIIGMARKDKKVSLYVLEMDERLSDKEHVPAQSEGVSARETYIEKTRRENMKHSMQSERNRSFFLRIREFQSKDKVFEVGSINSGAWDYGEACILFLKMMQAGWKPAEDSPFYKVDWERLKMTHIGLREEMDVLPQWSDDMQVVIDSTPADSVIELPVTLEIGQTKELGFPLEDGSSAVCYINNVQLMDVWADEEKKFADPAYRERMLQYMTEEALEQSKKEFFETLSENCPQGMCFITVEYECTKDISLRFYDREYLDGVEEPKEGGCSSVIMMAKPDVETGAHGLKMRACVIQKPVEPTVKEVNAELFAYSELIQKSVEKLFI